MKPQIQVVNRSWEQDAVKKIKELKQRIKTSNVSVKEGNKFVRLEEIIYYLLNPDHETTV